MTRRASAPPYRDEWPRALWHVSEDPSLERFAPHRARTALTDEPFVWAVDTRHLPLFWFPRECPRCTFWASTRTTDGDVDRFLEGRRDLRMHVVEEAWLERIRSVRLHLYRMPEMTFSEDPQVAGYWRSEQPVNAIARIEVDDPVALHERAGIRLRALANLWPLWDQVVASTLAFSGLRLRNASPRPER